MNGIPVGYWEKRKGEDRLGVPSPPELAACIFEGMQQQCMRLVGK